MPMNYSKVAAATLDAMDRFTSIPEERFQQVSASHAAACEEVNQRLRRACEWVSRGMNAEAIEECEREPNLLDAVAKLDIPDIQQWTELHDLFHMEIPSSVQYDLAATLNQAYAENAPLTSLLKKHRLLALGKGPLKARLQVLRQLFKRDQANEFWPDDLAVMERARIEEIRTFINSQGAQDVIALQRLSKELQKSHWQCSVPEELRDNVNDRLRLLQKEAWQDELRDVCAQLSLAHMEGDLNQGNRLRADFERLTQSLGVHVPAELVSEAQPSMDWLATEDERQLVHDQFCQVQQELEDVLDDAEATEDALEPLFSRLERFDFEIPALLRKRYSNRIDLLRLKEKRRFQRRMAIQGIAIACVAIVVGAMIRSHFIAERNRNAVVQITSLTEQKNWAAARQFYESLTDSVRETASVVTAYAPVLTVLSDRVTYLRDVEEKLQQVDSVDLNDESVLKTVRDRLDLLLSQHSLPPDDDVRTFERQYESLREEFDECVREETEKNDRQIAAALDLVRERLPTADLPTLRSLKKSLEILPDKYVSPASRITKDATFYDLIKRESDAKYKADMTMKRDSVGRRIGDWNAFQDALVSYLEELGSELPTEEQFQKWNAATSWVSKIPIYETEVRNLSIKQAETLLTALGPGPEQAVKFGGFVEDRAYLEDLEAIQTRKTVKDRTSDFMNRPRSGLFFIVAELQKNPERYYLRNGIDAPSDRFIDAIQNPAATSLKRTRVPSGQLKSQKAPQSRLASKISRRLSQLRDNDLETWEETYFLIIKDIMQEVGRSIQIEEADFASSEGIEPVILLDWLYEAWSDGGKGSTFLATTFENWEQHFDRIGPNVWGSNWAWPSQQKDFNNRQAREILNLIYESWPKPQKDNRPSLFQMAPNLQWVAMIGETGISPTPPDGVLFVPEITEDKVVIKRIGVCRNGQVSNIANLSSYGIGCPVFVHADAEE